MKFFEEEALQSLNGLGINPYDTVFFKGKPLSEHFKKAAAKGEDLEPLSSTLAEKLLKKNQSHLFICRLFLTDGLYGFAPPAALPLGSGNEMQEISPKYLRSITKHISQTQNQLLSVNNSHMRKLMQSAKKNAEFVERFNSELFFKHSFYQGRRITTAELFDFYETHPFYRTINLSSDQDKSPFIALYAMTFYACSPEDLFTVDGIFSMQPERHADNAKKTAGNSVFNLILRNDRAEIEQVLLLMGRTLMNVQPLRVNLSDAVMLSKNYTLFVGLSEMARVFLQVTSAENEPDITFNIPQEILRAAHDLMKYAPVAALCEAISVLYDTEDYRNTAAYKKCAEYF